MNKTKDPSMELRELIDNFQLLQLNGAKIGACHLSIDKVFFSCLKGALRNSQVIIPENKDEWNLLYSKLDEKIVDPIKISKALTIQTKKCVDLIKSYINNKPILFALGKIVRDFNGEE